jgi:hypothetical protein
MSEMVMSPGVRFSPSRFNISRIQQLLTVISPEELSALDKVVTKAERAHMEKRQAYVWHDSSYGWVWGTRFPDQRISHGAATAQEAVNEAIKFFCSASYAYRPYGASRIQDKAYLSIKVLYTEPQSPKRGNT